MCGVAGFLQRGRLGEDAASVAAAMGSAIAHRGPDHAAVWCDDDGGLAFAHQRLSILDLSPAGNQPMQSRTGRFVVTYNGEIYNFRELKAELSDVEWSGTSDTEVLVAAIERGELSERAAQASAPAKAGRSSDSTPQTSRPMGMK